MWFITKISEVRGSRGLQVRYMPGEGEVSSERTVTTFYLGRGCFIRPGTIVEVDRRVEEILSPCVEEGTLTRPFVDYTCLKSFNKRLKCCDIYVTLPSSKRGLICVVCLGRQRRIK